MSLSMPSNRFRLSRLSQETPLVTPEWEGALQERIIKLPIALDNIRKAARIEDIPKPEPITPTNIPTFPEAAISPQPEADYPVNQVDNGQVDGLNIKQIQSQVDKAYDEAA